MQIAARTAAWAKTIPYHVVSAIDMRGLDPKFNNYFFDSLLDPAKIGRLVIRGSFSVGIMTAYGSRLISNINPYNFRITISNYATPECPGGYIVFGKNELLNNHFTVNRETTWDLSLDACVIDGVDYGPFPPFSRPSSATHLIFFGLGGIIGQDQFVGVFNYFKAWDVNGRVMSEIIPVEIDGIGYVYDAVRDILFANEGPGGGFMYIE